MGRSPALWIWIRGHYCWWSYSMLFCFGWSTSEAMVIRLWSSPPCSCYSFYFSWELCFVWKNGPRWYCRPVQGVDERIPKKELHSGKRFDEYIWFCFNRFVSREIEVASVFVLSHWRPDHTWRPAQFDNTPQVITICDEDSFESNRSRHWSEILIKVTELYYPWV